MVWCFCINLCECKKTCYSYLLHIFCFLHLNKFHRFAFCMAFLLVLPFSCKMISHIKYFCWHKFTWEWNIWDLIFDSLSFVRFVNLTERPTIISSFNISPYLLDTSPQKLSTLGAFIFLIFVWTWTTGASLLFFYLFSKFCLRYDPLKFVI